MLYDVFEQKVRRVYDFKKFIVQNRYLLMSIAAVMVSLFTAFSITKGEIIEDDINISSPNAEYVDGVLELSYGDSYNISANAYFSKVSVEYKLVGSNSWSTVKPTTAGEYEFRFVSDQVFGKKYSDVNKVKINKKDITVSIDSTSYIYGEDNIIMSADLNSGDRFYNSVFNHTYVTNVFTTTVSVNEFHIVNQEGIDVTDSYNILNPDISKELTISKKDISFSSIDTLSKRYDSYLFDEEVLKENVATSSIRYNDVLTIDNLTYITSNQIFIGTYSYSVKQNNITILNSDNVDVTCFYNVLNNNLTYTISKRDLCVESLSKDFESYNGQFRSFNEYIIVDGYSLADNEIIDAYNFNQIKYAGSTDNTFMINVLNPSSVDVTYNYNITYVYGVLNIAKRTINITSASDSKVFDLVSLQNANYTFDSVNDELYEDEIIYVSNSSSITSVGEVSNELDCYVTYGNAYSSIEKQALKDSYEINITKGKLEVTTRTVLIPVADNNKQDYIYDGYSHQVNLYDDTYYAVNSTSGINASDEHYASSISLKYPNDCVWENGNNVDLTDYYITIFKRPVVFNDVDEVNEDYTSVEFLAKNYKSLFTFNNSLDNTGFIASDNIDFSVKFNERPLNVGKYYLTLDEYNKSEDVLNNYEISNIPNIEFNINKKGIYVKLLPITNIYKGDTYTFDNTQFKLYVDSECTTLWNASNVYVDCVYDNDETILSIINAKTYSIKLKELTGENAVNYTVLGSIDTTYTINPYSVYITPITPNKTTYNGAEVNHSISYKLTNMDGTDFNLFDCDINKDTVVTYNYIDKENNVASKVTHAGLYDIVIDSIACGDDANFLTNYSFNYVKSQSKFEIEKAKISIAPDNKDYEFVYTGYDIFTTNDIDYTYDDHAVTGTIYTDSDRDLIDNSIYHSYVINSDSIACTPIYCGTYTLLFDVKPEFDDYEVTYTTKTITITKRTVYVIPTAVSSIDYQGFGVGLSYLASIDDAVLNNYTCYYENLDKVTNNRLLRSDEYISITGLNFLYVKNSSNESIDSEPSNTINHAGTYSIYTSSIGNYTAHEANYNFVFDIDDEILEKFDITAPTILVNKINATIGVGEQTSTIYDGTSHGYDDEKSYDVSIVGSTTSDFLSPSEYISFNNDNVTYYSYLDGLGESLGKNVVTSPINAGMYILVCNGTYSECSDYLFNDYNITYASYDDVLDNDIFTSYYVINRRKGYIAPKYYNDQFSIEYDALNHYYPNIDASNYSQAFTAYLSGYDTSFDSRLILDSEVVSYIPMFEYTYTSSGTYIDSPSSVLYAKNAGTYYIYATSLNDLSVVNNYDLECIDIYNDTYQTVEYVVTKCSVLFIPDALPDEIYDGYSWKNSNTTYTALFPNKNNLVKSNTLLDGETVEFISTGLSFYSDDTYSELADPLNVGSYYYLISDCYISDGEPFNNNYDYSFDLSDYADKPIFNILKCDVDIYPISKTITYSGEEYTYNNGYVAKNYSCDSSIETSNSLILSSEKLILSTTLTSTKFGTINKALHAYEYVINFVSHETTELVDKNYNIHYKNDGQTLTINKCGVTLYPKDLNGPFTYNGKYITYDNTVFNADIDNIGVKSNHLILDTEVLELNVLFVDSSLNEFAKVMHANTYSIKGVSSSIDENDELTKYIFNDYDINYESSVNTFLIKPAKLTISADVNNVLEYTYIYDDTNKIASSRLNAFGVCSGELFLREDDNQDNITITSNIYKASTIQSEAVHHGTYKIKIDDESVTALDDTYLSDYDISFKDVKVVIEKRHVKVYAPDIDSIYYDSLSHNYDDINSTSPYVKYYTSAYYDEAKGDSFTGYDDATANALPFSKDFESISFSFNKDGSLYGTSITDAGDYEIIVSDYECSEDFDIETINIEYKILKRPIKVVSVNSSTTFDCTYHYVSKDLNYKIYIYNELTADYDDYGTNLLGSDVLSSIEGLLYNHDDNTISYEKVALASTYYYVITNATVSDNYKVSYDDTLNQTYTINAISIDVGLNNNDEITYSGNSYSKSNYVTTFKPSVYNYYSYDSLPYGSLDSDIYFVNTTDDNKTHLDSVKEVGIYNIFINNIVVTASITDSVKETVDNNIDITNCYNITNKSLTDVKTLTIKSRDVYIKLINDSFVYDGQSHVYSYKYKDSLSLLDSSYPNNSLVSGDSLLIDVKYVKDATDYTNPVNAGTYDIYGLVATSKIYRGKTDVTDKYVIHFVNNDENKATLTIDPYKVTIKLGDATLTYDDREFTVTDYDAQVKASTITKSTNLNTLKDNDVIAYYYTIVTKHYEAGEYVIVSENPKHANDAGYIYEIVKDTTTYPLGYNFTSGSDNESNYEVVFSDDEQSIGHLTINRLALFVNPTENYSKPYDNSFFGSDDLNEFNITYADGTPYTKVTFNVPSLSLSDKWDVGTYSVKAESIASVNAPSGFSYSDYNITYNSADWTITKANVKVTINNQTVTYGDSYKSIYLTSDYTVASGSLYQDVTITLRFKQNDAVITPRHVGVYNGEILSCKINNSEATNYNITFSSTPTLTISPFNVSVSLQNENTYYGYDYNNITYKAVPSVTLPYTDKFNVLEVKYNDSIDGSVGKYSVDYKTLSVSSTDNQVEFGQLTDYNVSIDSLNQGYLYINMIHFTVTFNDTVNSKLVYNALYQDATYTVAYYYLNNNLTTGDKHNINIDNLFNVSLTFEYSVSGTPIVGLPAHAGTYDITGVNWVVKKNNVTQDDTVFINDALGAHSITISPKRVEVIPNKVSKMYNGENAPYTGSDYTMDSTNKPVGSDILTFTTVVVDSTRENVISSYYHAGTYYYYCDGTYTLNSVKTDNMDVTSLKSDYDVKVLSSVVSSNVIPNGYGEIIITQAPITLRMNYALNNQTRDYKGSEFTVDPYTDWKVSTDTKDNLLSIDKFNVQYNRLRQDLDGNWIDAGPMMIDAREYRIYIASVNSIVSEGNVSYITDYNITIDKDSYSTFTIIPLKIYLEYKNFEKVYDSLPMFDKSAATLSTFFKDVSASQVLSTSEILELKTDNLEYLDQFVNVVRDASGNVTTQPLIAPVVVYKDNSKTTKTTQNYEIISSNEGKVLITPYKVEISSPTITDFVYDGTKNLPQCSPSVLTDYITSKENTILPINDTFKIVSNKSLSLYSNIPNDAYISKDNINDFINVQVYDVYRNGDSENSILSNYDITYDYGTVHISNVTVYVVVNNQTVEYSSSEYTNPSISIYKDSAYTIPWNTSSDESFSVSISNINQTVNNLGESVDTVVSKIIDAGTYEITVSAPVVSLKKKYPIELTKYINLVFKDDASKEAEVIITKYPVKFETISKEKTVANINNPPDISYNRWRVYDKYNQHFDSDSGAFGSFYIPDTVNKESLSYTIFTPTVNELVKDNIITIEIFKMDGDDKIVVTDNYEFDNHYGKLIADFSINLAYQSYYGGIYSGNTIFQKQVVNINDVAMNLYVMKFDIEGLAVTYYGTQLYYSKDGLSYQPVDNGWEVGYYKWDLLDKSLFKYSSNGEEISYDTIADNIVSEPSLTGFIAQRTILIKPVGLITEFDNETHTISNDGSSYELVTIEGKTYGQYEFSNPFYSSLGNHDYLVYKINGKNAISLKDVDEEELQITDVEVRHMIPDGNGVYNESSYVIVTDSYKYFTEITGSSSYPSEVMSIVYNYNSTNEMLAVYSASKVYARILKILKEVFNVNTTFEITPYILYVGTGSSTVDYKVENADLGYTAANNWQLSNTNYEIYNDGAEKVTNGFMVPVGNYNLLVTLTIEKSIVCGNGYNVIDEIYAYCNDERIDEDNFVIKYQHDASNSKTTKGKLTINSTSLTVSVKPAGYSKSTFNPSVTTPILPEYVYLVCDKATLDSFTNECTLDNGDTIIIKPNSYTYTKYITPYDEEAYTVSIKKTSLTVYNESGDKVTSAYSFTFNSGLITII